MTELRLDSNCRQKVAYNAKVKIGAILLVASITYTMGWFTVAMCTIALIDRPFDVNSPAARFFITGVVFIVFIVSLIPLIRNLKKRQSNRTDYYCHTNHFFTTAEYTLDSLVSGTRYQTTYYFADILYNGEATRLQLLKERHWMYLNDNPGTKLLFVTSQSGEIRPLCMAYDLIHSKKGAFGGRISNLIAIVISILICIIATFYCMEIITDTLQYLP